MQPPAPLSPPQPPTPPLAPVCQFEVDLAFVLDRSGSMQGELDAVRGFARGIADRLDLTNAINPSTVTIVDFEADARLLLTRSSSRASIVDVIDHDYGPAYGPTSISSGLLMAYDALSNPNATNTAIGCNITETRAFDCAHHDQVGEWAGNWAEGRKQVIMLLTDGRQGSTFGGDGAAIATANSIKTEGLVHGAVHALERALVGHRVGDVWRGRGARGRGEAVAI